MDTARPGNFESAFDLIKQLHNLADIPEILGLSNCFVIAEVDKEGVMLCANTGADYVFFSDFGSEECNIANSFINPSFNEIQSKLKAYSIEGLKSAILFEGILNVGNPALMVHSLNGRIFYDGDKLIVVAEHDVQQLINLNQKVVDLNNELANAHRNLAKLNRQLSAEQTKTEKLLITDQLTQAPNRFALNKRVDEELDRFKRYHQNMTFALLDIDNFKSVNDEFGHNVGDKALIYLVDWLRANLRKSDFFARWGGEEFVIMFPGTGVEEAFGVLDRIREDLASIEFEPINRPLTFSAGILQFSFSLSLDQIFKLADEALYVSKQEGRNRITRAKH